MSVLGILEKNFTETESIEVMIEAGREKRLAVVREAPSYLCPHKDLIIASDCKCLMYVKFQFTIYKDDADG